MTKTGTWRQRVHRVSITWVALQSTGSLQSVPLAFQGRVPFRCLAAVDMHNSRGAYTCLGLDPTDSDTLAEFLHVPSQARRGGAPPLLANTPPPQDQDPNTNPETNTKSETPRTSELEPNPEPNPTMSRNPIDTKPQRYESPGHLSPSDIKPRGTRTPATITPVAI